MPFRTVDGGWGTVDGEDAWEDVRLCEYAFGN